MPKKMPFKDPVVDHTPTKTMKSPWDFTTPEYDERSSCFISAGADHGVGHKQPVGHKGNPSNNHKTIPLGIKRFEDY